MTIKSANKKNFRRKPSKAPIRKGEMRLSEDGFTLIETILAIAILVIGIAGVLMMFAAGVKNERLAKMETCAIFLAQAKLEEAAPKPYSDISSETEDYGAIEGFESYKRVTKADFWDPVASATTSVDTRIKRVEVTISWDSGKGSTQLITLIRKK